MDWMTFFDNLGGREIRISQGYDSDGFWEIAVRLHDEQDAVADTEVLFFPEEVPEALMRLVEKPVREGE